MIRIEKEQGGIGLVSLDAPDFEKIGEDLLTESILPENLSDVIEKLESPADDAEALLDDNVASSVEQESEDSELDLSAGELDKGFARWAEQAGRGVGYGQGGRGDLRAPAGLRRRGREKIPLELMRKPPLSRSSQRPRPANRKRRLANPSNRSCALRSGTRRRLSGARVCA